MKLKPQDVNAIEIFSCMDEKITKKGGESKASARAIVIVDRTLTSHVGTIKSINRNGGKNHEINTQFDNGCLNRVVFHTRLGTR
jgi:hypothetical protein